MDCRKAWRRVACGLLCLTAVYAFQRPFRQFPGVEYFTFELTSGHPVWPLLRVTLRPANGLPMVISKRSSS